MKSTLRVLAAVTAVLLMITMTAVAGGTIRRVLPENGMTVILQENHSSPVINMRFYVRAGSIYEGEYLGAGISHYCEHVLSDGTPTRTLEDIERELEAIGGGYNAYTTKNHTCYFIETSSEHFDKALELLSDQAMNASLPQEEVDAQHSVITREISMGYDEPGRRIYALFGETMFSRHPAKYPVIGYLENFLRLTRDDLVSYIDKMYVPNNMVFVVAGDFDAEVAYAKIREAFIEFERRPLDIPTLTAEPQQLGRRTLRSERDLDMAYVMMGFHTVALSDPDLYPLDVLSHIMSEGESSRLHRRLVNELGLAYSVASWSSTPSYGAGTFVVSMTMDPKNIDAAVDAVLEELYLVTEKNVSKSELAKAKRLKAAGFHLGRQDMESIASSLGTSELSTGNPDFEALYVSHIQEVTAQEIREAAAKYFYDDNLGVAILEPIVEEETAAPTSSVEIEVGEIEKHVLDNGLTVLIKRNRTSPIVTVGSYSFGGTRFESADNSGLGNFVAQMMPRGTKKRSGLRISEAFDSMGAAYYSSGNHTRIQSELTLLSADLSDGFEIFADILMNPKFDPVQVEKERELVQAAILARGDNWTADALDRMRLELLGNHPYAMSSVGTEETAAAITREDLIRHHAMYVAPDNTVLTVFGDVDPDEALALVEKTFRKWKPSGVVLPEPAPAPERTEPATLTSYHNKAQTVIAIGYGGMPYESEDRYATDVLDAVVSGIYYPGGRLHADLRGQGLVYVVHAYNWTGYDIGYFAIYAATFDEALDQAMGIIEGHMGRIAEELVTEEELELAKQLCIIMDQTSNQTNSNQAVDAAIAELYGLGYDYTEDYDERIREITREDVLRVAGKYLTNPVTILRRPEPEEE